MRLFSRSKRRKRIAMTWKRYLKSFGRIFRISVSVKVLEITRTKIRSTALPLPFRLRPFDDLAKIEPQPVADLAIRYAALGFHHINCIDLDLQKSSDLFGCHELVCY